MATQRKSKKADDGQFIDSPIRFRRDEIKTFSPILQFTMAQFPDIQTVEDSFKSIGIPVFKQDIDHAERGNPAHCAVALGAQRNVPGLTGAVINRSGAILIYHLTRAVRFAMPKGTHANLYAFDRGGTIEEGVYLLGAVPPGSRLISMQGRVMQSRKATGRPRAQKGEKRPAAKKSHNRKIAKPHSLFLRTWGNARVHTTLASPTTVGASSGNDAV